MQTSQHHQTVNLRGLKRTVAPIFQPLKVLDIKQSGRIDDNGEIRLIHEYIDAATDYAQDHQNRCLCQSTWQAVYDSFPSCGVFYLERPPLVSVTSVTYLDLNGDTQTLATSVYKVDAVSEPGRVALKYGQIWPQIRREIAAVTITYVAGFTAAASIKPATRQAIRVLAQHCYEYREPIVDGRIANVPISVMEMLDVDRFVSYR